jgi:beta-mannan synthase
MDAIARVNGAGEEMVASVWDGVPVRVDWAAAASQCAYAWAQARAFVLVPAIRLLLALSLAMTVMILVEKLFVAAVYFTVKALGLKPERRYQWRPIEAAAAIGDGDAGDEEAVLGASAGGGGASAAFPVVLVQIPMYNEREVSVSVNRIHGQSV